MIVLFFEIVWTCLESDGKLSQMCRPRGVSRETFGNCPMLVLIIFFFIATKEHLQLKRSAFCEIRIHWSFCRHATFRRSQLRKLRVTELTTTIPLCLMLSEHTTAKNACSTTWMWCMLLFFRFPVFHVAMNGGNRHDYENNQFAAISRKAGPSVKARGCRWKLVFLILLGQFGLVHPDPEDMAYLALNLFCQCHVCTLKTKWSQKI